jgi:hypothetical protein
MRDTSLTEQEQMKQFAKGIEEQNAQAEKFSGLGEQVGSPIHSGNCQNASSIIATGFGRAIIA